jgi:hypothetical protein
MITRGVRSAATSIGGALCTWMLLAQPALTSGEPPTPLLPEEGAVLPQDNLFGECTIYGLGWEFAWSEAGEGAQYELYVEREGGPTPYVAQMLDDATVRVARCGCLPDNMLTGWRWRVRARAPAGEWSDWSDWRGFSVARLPICLRGGQEN